MVKPIKPTLQANFAKEPFRTSRQKEKLIDKIYRQCLTAGIVHKLWRASGDRKVSRYLLSFMVKTVQYNTYDTIPAKRYNAFKTKLHE